MQSSDEDRLFDWVSECGKIITEIQGSLQLQPNSAQVRPLRRKYGELGERYRQWSNNYGASLQRSRETSVGELVEDLPLIHDTLCHSLDDLHETLSIVLKIVLGERKNTVVRPVMPVTHGISNVKPDDTDSDSSLTDLSFESSSLQTSPNLETDELFRSASKSIDSLFKSSSLLRVEQKTTTKPNANDEPELSVTYSARTSPEGTHESTVARSMGYIRSTSEIPSRDYRMSLSHPEKIRETRTRTEHRIHNQADPSRATSYLDLFARRLKEEWTHTAHVACYRQCQPLEDCTCKKQFINIVEVIKWMKRHDFEDMIPGSVQSPNAAQLLDEIDRKVIVRRPFPLDWRRIVDESVLVFSTLLDIGYGELIVPFQRAGICDASLAQSNLNRILELELHGIHQSEKVETILQDFEVRKWAYLPCWPTWQMDQNLESGAFIVPFCRRLLLTKQSSSPRVYRALIQDFLVTDERLKTALSKSLCKDTEFGLCYEMTIKEYTDDTEQLYHLERRAFSGTSADKNIAIVQYFGCYTQGRGGRSRTFNLLLERGQRNLNEYFESRVIAPPVQTEEIIRFWEALFNIAEAGHNVHKVNSTLKNEPGFDGFHTNIQTDSVLDVYGVFKLGGFGNKSAPDGGTFSAPEIGPIWNSKTSIASQESDVWSFGAVLSIAATWVVLGSQGITQYRVLRQSAASNQSLFRDNYERFHDGVKPLQEVRDWHQYLRSLVRKSDTITPQLLDWVDEDMLQDVPTRRMKFRQLCERLRNSIASELDRTDSRSDSRVPSDSVRRALLVADESFTESFTEPKPSLDVSLDAIKEVGLRPRTLGKFPSRIAKELKKNRNYYPERSIGLLKEELLANGSISAMTSPIAAESRPKLAPDVLSSPLHVYDLPWDICKVRQSLELRLSNTRKSVIRQMISKKSEVHDSVLAKQLSGRDIVLVVDNGSTMNLHWPMVVFVAQTLAIKIAGQVQDGLDVHFTRNGKSLNMNKLKDTRRTGKNFERACPRTATGGEEEDLMEEELVRVAEDYLTDPQQLRPKTVIVLTDGVWVAHANSSVTALVLRFPPQLMLQIIRFGDRSKEKDNLDHLSNISNSVDCCTWKDEVHKMITGSSERISPEVESHTNYDSFQLYQLFEDYNRGK